MLLKRTLQVLALTGGAVTSEACFGQATTTIITHGFDGDCGSNQSAWMDAMGRAIISRAGGGTLLTYMPANGRWRLANGYSMPIDETRPIVLVFDWVRESDNGLFNPPLICQSISGINWGYASAAADALHTALRQPAGDLAGTNVLAASRQIHFIGHSRGAVVNSECIRRLATVAPIVQVDQMTTLDPHPVDEFAPWLAWGDTVPRRWNNVHFADNYWRNDEFDPTDFNGMALDDNVLDRRLSEAALEGCSGAGPRPCPQTGLCYWDGGLITTWHFGYTRAHSDVHLWYLGTINPSSGASNGDRCIFDEMREAWYANRPDVDGFDFSTIVGGARPDLSDGDSPASTSVIENGSFDRGSSAGWQFHGGDGTGIVKTDGASTDGYLRLKKNKHWRRHNRFFLPAGASGVVFDYRVKVKSNDDRLLVRLIDQDGGSYPLPSISLSNKTSWIRGHAIALGSAIPRGSAYRLDFVIASSTGPIDSEVHVDNIDIDVSDAPDCAAVLALASGSTLAALNLNTNEAAWPAVNVGFPIGSQMVVVADDDRATVVVYDNTQPVSKGFDLATGALLWTRNGIPGIDDASRDGSNRLYGNPICFPHGPPRHSSTAAPSLLLFQRAAGSTTTWLVDSRSGAIHWTRVMPSESFGFGFVPRSDGRYDVIFRGQNGGPLMRVDGNTGQGFVWSQNLPFRACMPVPDFTGDGQYDLVARANYTDSVLWINGVNGSPVPPQVNYGSFDVLGAVATTGTNGSAADIILAAQSSSAGGLRRYRVSDRSVAWTCASSFSNQTMRGLIRRADGGLTVLSGWRQQGKAVAVRAESGATLWSNVPLTDQDNGLLAAPDMNGDGNEDVISISGGFARPYDGSSGAQLSSFAPIAATAASVWNVTCSTGGARLAASHGLPTIAPDEPDAREFPDQLLDMFLHWGLCDDCEADMDGDGFVDVRDLTQLLSERP